MDSETRLTGLAAMGLRSLFAKKDAASISTPPDKRLKIGSDEVANFSPFPQPTLANATGARIGFVTFVFEDDFDLLVSEDWESGRQKHFFHKGKDLVKDAREHSLSFSTRKQREGKKEGNEGGEEEKKGEKRTREESTVRDPWAWTMGPYKMFYQADYDLGSMVRFQPFGYLVFRNCQVIDTNLELEEIVFPMQYRKNIIDFHKVVIEKSLMEKMDTDILKIVGRRWMVSEDASLESFVEEKWNLLKKENPDFNSQEICDLIVKQWEQFKEKEETPPPNEEKT
eukprot:TRINITY_DN3287_c1_g1_i1.p1 TRINITY_DN3287_c1_g1~~TRINITY_DN3287_c1_g1_i1.p1  ORF type:complete len:283 (+),score=94.07 TRINITY_DN3287_c1_g1_i1:433-1281(+)